jgi:aspartate aminotransferase-like enzyme
MMKAEGLEAMYARHALLSRMTRAGLKALECSLLAEKAPCPSVTGFFPPNGIDADTVRTDVRKNYGIRLAGGQGKLKGKIVRVGHMGYVDPFDIIAVISAIGRTLNKLGYKADVGTAVSTILQEI